MLNKELLLSSTTEGFKLYVSRRPTQNPASITIIFKDDTERLLENYEVEYQVALHNVKTITVSPMDYVEGEAYEDVDESINLINEISPIVYTVIHYDRDAFLSTRPMYN